MILINYLVSHGILLHVFFFQAEDGIRDPLVAGVQTCALPIFGPVSVAFRDPRRWRLPLTLQHLLTELRLPLAVARLAVPAPGLRVDPHVVLSQRVPARATGPCGDRVGNVGAMLLQHKMGRLAASPMQALVAELLASRVLVVAVMVHVQVELGIVRDRSDEQLVDDPVDVDLACGWPVPLAPSVAGPVDRAEPELATVGLVLELPPPGRGHGVR